MQEKNPATEEPKPERGGKVKEAAPPQTHRPEVHFPPPPPRRGSPELQLGLRLSSAGSPDRGCLVSLHPWLHLEPLRAPSQRSAATFTRSYSAQRVK